VAGKDPQQVTAGDDADQAALGGDRDGPEASTQHQLRRPRGVLLRGQGDHLRRHHLGDGVWNARAVGGQRKDMAARIRSGLQWNEVGLGDDPDQLVTVDHRQRVEAPLHQQLGGFLDGGLGSHRDHRARHDISYAHPALPL
jgi:hypothetical protein